MPVPALPFAARQHFLQHGYAILPNVLAPATVQSLRDGALQSTTARSRVFYNPPALEDLLKTSGDGRVSDPMLDPMLERIEKRKILLRYYKELKRRRRALTRTVRSFLNGRDKTDLSEQELWRLSELVAQEARKGSGRGCTSTVTDDPQMLSAINTYRANAWMTNSLLKSVLTEDESLKASLAMVSEIVGGVEKPVVFSDAPLLRPAFGNPVGYQCTAPLIGTKTNALRRGGSAAAVTLVLFTYTPSTLKLEPFVLRNSHRFVRDQYISRVHPRTLFSPFFPNESHVAFQLQRFQFDASVMGASVLSGPEGSGETGSSAPASAVTAGTVMVVDPHLLMAFGPNVSQDDEVVYRLNVVSEDARAYLTAPSWVRGWRSVPREVHFASPIVFPPLYA